MFGNMKHDPHQLMVILFVLIVGVVSFQVNVNAGTWNLNVRQTEALDYCSSKRNIIIEFVLDADMYFADSIYGFDVEFEYDTQKLTLFQNLEAGTLFGKVQSGESSGIKTVDFSQPGFVYISFANIASRPIAGSRVLTRIAGEIKGDCKDSTYIVIRSFQADYEFSKKHYFNAVYYPVGYKIEIGEQESAKRPISYRLNKGNTRIDTIQKTIPFAFAISHTDVNRAKQMFTTIELGNAGSKYVDSINVLAFSENIELQRIERIGNIYTLEYQLKRGSKDERIDCSIFLDKMIDNMDSLNLSVQVKSNEQSTCTCTLLNSFDTLEYLWLKEKDTISTVITDTDYSNHWVTVVNKQEKIILYKTISSEISFSIYNIHGELVEVNKNLSNVEILQSQPSGVYLMVVDNYTGGKSHESRFQLIKIYK